MSLFIPIYRALEVVFILVDVALLIGFIYAFRESWKYRPHFHHPKEHKPDAARQARRAEYARRWGTIMAKFSTGNSADARKLAIIEADKLIDTMLKDAGLSGDTMADRLKQLSAEEVQSLDRLWRAHRLRNELVHSHDFEVSLTTAERVMQDYEAFLKEFKIV